ncbi:hypothetical protein GCM10023201_21140 [Actinomycetospora corticicola]
MLLGSLADRRGLVPGVETGLFRTGDDYHVPDQLHRPPDDGSSRGGEGAELIVEFLPQDETVAKLPLVRRAGRAGGARHRARDPDRDAVPRWPGRRADVHRGPRRGLRDRRGPLTLT